MAYTPTTWNNGDLITAEKLNKLEQGVKNEQVGPQGPKGDPGAKGDKGDPGEAYTLPAAKTNVLGGVKQAAAVPDAAAAPTKEEFNALLASLRAAGILANA
ncbi:hypothetical protein B5F10_18660 [Anaerotruncus colihominis]|uniref:Head fiber protein n=1 Tax=Anaerotruncus colihominis TaxID=169435 RepID=A0A1Y4MEE5_9FIRM|nr:head fiber protein [Anaerotruncus colihominis]OUP67134.1 hypothetical protein B5F11_18655 [Anaerotruncus colihominis]OUP70764.1 hypothetical protein B5F10_18660 [Anaerotruncus colihominis]HJF55799.1 hypothetical protein [Anaerotruncus colihominis]